VPFDYVLFRLVKEGYHKMTESANQSIAVRIAAQFPAYCDRQGRVGHQELDGALAAAVETSAWRMLRRRAEEAEQQCAAQTTARLLAEMKIKTLELELAVASDTAITRLQQRDEAQDLLNKAWERADAAERKAEALMVALAQAVDELTEAQNERNKAEGLAEAYCATYRSTRCLWHATAAQRDDLHRDKEYRRRSSRSSVAT
jgi:LPS O-antigen subunit length determinant protein (WzzB/FepE family)